MTAIATARPYTPHAEHITTETARWISYGESVHWIARTLGYPTPAHLASALRRWGVHHLADQVQEQS